MAGQGVWRQIRRRWWGRVAVVVAAVIMAVGLVLAVQVHLYGAQDGATAADVIVVLGGGLDPDGSPNHVTVRRAAHGAALYAAGYAPAIVCAGGFTRGIPMSEAAACAEVLVAHGVPRAAIWLEEASHSTEENAIHTAVLMRQQGWQTALLTSDRFHLWRARMLFEKYGVTVAGTSPAQATGPALNPLEYVGSVGREVLALFWQVGKDALGLPFTDV